MHKAIKPLLGLLMVTLLLFVAACGDDEEESGSSGSTTTAADGDDAGAAGLAEAKKIQQEALTQFGEFQMPTEPFDPGNKKGLVIASGFLAPVIAEQAKIAVEAFKTMGWDAPPPLDGKFLPATVGGYIEQAIADKVDGIVFISHNVDDNKAQVEKARDAGIAMSCVNCAVGDELKAMGVTDVSVDFEKQGELQGWNVIALSEGKGKIVITTDPSRQPVVKRVAGTERIIKENCPGCEYEIKTITVAETAKPGPPTWTSLLATRPEGEITHGISYYDGMAVPMAKSAETSGRTDVAVLGYDADAAAIEMVRKGPVFVTDIAIPYSFETWGAVDQVGREKAGLEPWDSDDQPSKLITKDNAAEYTPWFSPEGDWEGEYKKLWGKG